MKIKKLGYKILRPMSLLGKVNFFVLQWLGVRLARIDDRGWGMLVGVVPLTGWWTRYVPRRPRLWRWW